MIRYFCRVISLGVLVSGVALAQPNKANPSVSLKGIKAVGIVVHYQAPREEPYGLTANDIRDAVKTRLEANNVTYLSDTDLVEVLGKPYLFVDVVGARLEKKKDQEDEFLYTFALNLVQQVRLERHTSALVEGVTWSKGYSAVLPKEDLRTITVKISDLTWKFAQALQKANSR